MDDEIQVPDEETTDTEETEAVSEGVPVTFPVVIVEGMETSDGRYIQPGALQARALPMPILSMTRNPEGGDGHAGAEVIGRIDVLTRVDGPSVINKQTGQPFPEGTYVWSASGEIDPDAPSAALIRKGYLTGNSADLSDVQAEVIWGEEDEDGYADIERIEVASGFISGTTVCPFPAFAEAYIVYGGEEIRPADDMPEAIAASAWPSWTSSDVGDDCLPCAAGAVTASVGEDEAPLPHVGAFSVPQFTSVTPLTFTPPDASGYRQVYGHIAEWGTCHVGFKGTCKTPPRSNSDYAYFHTGAIDVQDDNGDVSTIPVGRLTYDSGHADLASSASATAAHYDNTATLGAYVQAGEDEYGIWVHGVVLPSADVQKMKATPPSGDWRPIRGGLELMAVLHVNTPGFPVPRALVAGGQVQAMVAAGVVATQQQAEEFASRLTADEVADRVLAKLDERHELNRRQIAALEVLDKMQAEELATRRAAALELLDA